MESCSEFSLSRILLLNDRELSSHGAFAMKRYNRLIAAERTLIAYATARPASMKGSSLLRSFVQERHSSDHVQDR